MNPNKHKPIVLYDKWLIAAALGLILLGLMMVASSSVMMSTKNYQEPFHFLIRQATYLFIGCLAGIVVMRIDSSLWEKISVPLLLVCFVLLLLVLIPGIGHRVNGSRRWLALGPIGIQVSEITKIAMIFYLSGYMVRQKQRIRESILGFFMPMMVLGFISVLLLLEPDFGATVVITSTTMVLLFLMGVRLRYYVGLLMLVGAGLAFLAISSPYRMARLTGFLNPWADQFNSGYQLTQSLIAFGRGGISGVGLGESIQKLFYLPEAHTDFLFAVLAEELGLLGIFLVIALYSILVIRGLKRHWTLYYLWQNKQFAITIEPNGLNSWTLQLGPTNDRITFTGTIQSNQLILNNQAVQTKHTFVDHDSHVTLFTTAGPITLKRITYIPQDISATISTEQHLTAPMPATVIALLKQPGDRIKAGENILILEAMKMEHAIKAPQDGLIKSIFYAIGAQVSEGDLLVDLCPLEDLEDMTCVSQAT
jgi:cell division protein FtsW